jgi:ribose 5-phosphate isomerase A
MVDQKELMYKAGKASLEYIPEDAKVAVFGAGRTVCQALQAFVDHGLHDGRIVVCGSEGTERFARDLGVNIGSMEDLTGNYVYIDGADQIDPHKNLIKGGFKNTGDPGLEGCMYREKQIAYRAGTFIVIADYSKCVDYLGQDNYKLPIEFIPEEEDVVKYIVSYFAEPNLRKKPDGTPFVTENNNHILDVPFDGRQHDLSRLESSLNDKAFSTGLFAIRKPEKVIVASDIGTIVKS